MVRLSGNGVPGAGECEHSPVVRLERPAPPEDLAVLPGWALHQAAETYRRLADQITAPFGVQEKHVPLLVMAGLRPEGMPAFQIQTAIRRDRTTTLILIDDCERAGLIRRIPDSEDRRIKRIALTEGGRDVLPGILRKRDAAYQELLSQETAGTVREFERVLQHLL